MNYYPMSYPLRSLHLFAYVSCPLRDYETLCENDKIQHSDFFLNLTKNRLNLKVIGIGYTMRSAGLCNLT